MRYLRISTDDLQLDAPTDGVSSYIGRVVVDDEIITEGTLKTLQEFTFDYLTVDMGDDTSIILLAEYQYTYGRQIGVSDTDDTEWDVYIESIGYSVDDILTQDEKDTLVDTLETSEDEEEDDAEDTDDEEDGDETVS